MEGMERSQKSKGAEMKAITSFIMDVDKVKAIFAIWIVAVVALLLAGCSHNPALFTMGKRTNIGFDPASASANISWTDGLNIIDVPRENSSFSIEIDEGMGLQFDQTTNTIKGVKKITRRTGIQVTGYLVDLAKANPELAKKYLDHYFEQEKETEK
jgi:hypothetical protein